jgi:tetratricopeptide (TPR) repeat protein
MKTAFALLLAIASASAQHDDPAPAGEKPVALLPGLGTWKHPISTSSAEAQKFFDQGLTLMYGFNRYEAMRSFRKAVKLDPRAAMAYWGLAMASGPYINIDLEGKLNMKESCEAAGAGLRAQGLKPVERDWLQAALKRCPNYDPAVYIKAMRALAARYPEDPDAQTLYAEALLLPVRWRWYDNQGNAAEGVAEAEHVLEAVMRRFPMHPGANHLYIHAVESSRTPERAVASAQRLMGATPSAGHMVHMPAHIWLVLGDYEMAASVNERAAEVDRQYFARTGVGGGYFMYYMHNLDFIVYARAMQGRWKATSAAVRQMTDAGRTIAGAMPEMAAIFDVVASQTLLRMYRWDDVLRIAPPKAANPLAQAFYHHARGLALAGKGRRDEARQAQSAFEKERVKVDRNMPFGNNKAGAIFDLAAATLDARVAPSPAGSVAKWKQAVALQDRLVYDEPPGWYYPIRESLGAALLLAGDAAGAEQIFREGLRRSPNNGRMLFGLLESLKRQGKSESAYWAQREFERAWSGADVELKLEDL